MSTTVNAAFGYEAKDNRSAQNDARYTTSGCSLERSKIAYEPRDTTLLRSITTEREFANERARAGRMVLNARAFIIVRTRYLTDELWDTSR